MDLLEKVRLKMQRKTNLRNAVRLFVGFASGIIAGISQSWIVLLVLVSAYCLFEMVLLFSMYRSRFLYENRFLEPEDNPEMEGRPNVMGESINYAFSLSVRKFLRSFILLSMVGVLTKVVVIEFLFFL